MKKLDQMAVNAACESIWNLAMNEYENYCRSNDYCTRLLSCQAWVYETDNYYILRSYNTMVAVIDKKSDTLVDMLRGVYGYTATSAKHISKFSKSPVFGGYGMGKWGCENILTYREV